MGSRLSLVLCLRVTVADLENFYNVSHRSYILFDLRCATGYLFGSK